MATAQERIDALVVALESGKRGAFEALVAGLRELPLDHNGLLVELADHSHPGVRTAVVRATATSSDDERRAIALRALGDPDANVRMALAREVAASPERFDDALRLELTRDESWPVREVAVLALRASAAGDARVTERVLEILREDEDDEVRAAAATTLAPCAPAIVLGALVRALAREREQPKTQRAILRAIDQALLSLEHGTALRQDPRPSEWDEARTAARSLGADAHPAAQAWLEERAAAHVDLDALREFGTLVTEAARAGELPRAFCVDAEVAALESCVRARGNRSAVLLGAPGVGKTAIVDELAHRLTALAHSETGTGAGAGDGPGHWHVLRFTPSDLLAGTKYLGEWQTRLQRLVALCRAPRRVVLHVTGFHEMFGAGRSTKSDASILTMLAPHVESGAICLIGETTPENYRAVAGTTGPIRRLFRAIDVLPRDPRATRTILHGICAEAGLRVPGDVSEDVLERLNETADMFLAGAEQPARSAGLLRRVLDRSGGRAFTTADVLGALSSSTGVPLDLVDDARPLDLAAVRAFFEARVMGQDEAVDAVIDLVTLVKAGLNDPQKPLGVLFFVGPTGVGKTELARALAEHLFGDPNRLLRVDMSEYAFPGAAERLTGGPGQPGVLTGPVRDQPFTVVLLDEIEKAHGTVYDLCLQLFDAGRLSDANGTATDFRRTIVVLTSNVGAAVPTEASVGFGRSTPRAPDETSVMRALREFFRPEFLNRIDRIVCFRPLQLETAEKIVRRELARVLERSGIHRRGILVDVAPEVVALLLERGYSPAFGARPLKRTIERAVLIPLSRAIATGATGPSSVVSLSVRQREIVVAAHDAHPTAHLAADETHATDDRRTDALAVDLHAQVHAAENAVLALRESSQAWLERRSRLFEAAQASGFWHRRAEAARTMDELHRIDGCLARFEAFERESRGAIEFALRARDRRSRLAAAERLARLDRARADVAFLAGLGDARELRDAFVVLRRLRSRGPRLDAVELVSRMLTAHATRHGLECDVIADARAKDGEDDTVVLEIVGPGAFARLEHEDGLHQFHRAGPPGAARGPAREVVRVEILPADASDAELASSDVHAERRSLPEAVGRTTGVELCERALLHRPTHVSLRLATHLDDDVLEPLLRLLAARVATRQGRGTPSVVRRYDLGASPRVFDRRSGVRTGRLQRVLEGDFAVFAPRGE